MANKIVKIIPLFLLLSSLTGCLSSPSATTEEEIPLKKTSSLPAVDVVEVRRGLLFQPREYIGTSEPVKEITVRSQGEGQLLNLTVDVGDRVRQGEVVAQLDDSLPKVAVSREEEELARLESELLEADAQVISAQAEVESAEIKLLQAQVDFERLEQLYNEGAIAQRDLELAQTEAQTNRQLVASTRSQVKVRQARILTIQNEIERQKTVIEAEKKRLTFTKIKSPSSGYVLKKLTEVGSLVRVGEELLKIGDLSQIKIRVAVSELDLNKIKLNSRAYVTFDAFTDRKFIGIIDTISPVADIQARQIPIEILLSNPSGKIKSGLLSRVTFSREEIPPVIVPQSALTINNNSDRNIVFVLDNQTNDRRVRVRIRKVAIGKTKNGKVEILSGLTSRERVVSKSTGILQDGQKVRLSAISLPPE